jgi:hypothetical protein
MFHPQNAMRMHATQIRKNKNIRHNSGILRTQSTLNKPLHRHFFQHRRFNNNHIISHFSLQKFWIIILQNYTPKSGRREEESLSSYFGRPPPAAGPGFPLQVLGFAHANPAGFPLQSLAPPSGEHPQNRYAILRAITPRKRRGMVVSDRYGLYRGFNTSVFQQCGRIKNRPRGGVLNPLAGIKFRYKALLYFFDFVVISFQSMSREARKARGRGSR